MSKRLAEFARDFVGPLLAGGDVLVGPAVRPADFHEMLGAVHTLRTDPVILARLARAQHLLDRAWHERRVGGHRLPLVGEQALEVEPVVGRDNAAREHILTGPAEHHVRVEIDPVGRVGAAPQCRPSAR